MIWLVFLFILLNQCQRENNLFEEEIKIEKIQKKDEIFQNEEEQNHPKEEEIDQKTINLEEENLNNFEENQQNWVIELSGVDYQKLTSEGDWFIMFYAPWSGFSVRVMPLWEVFAREIKKKIIPLNVAKMDCSVEKETCAGLSLVGYPTLMLFMDSRSTIYSGMRSLDLLLNYYIDKSTRREIKKAEDEQSQLPTDVISLNVSNFDSIINSGPVLVMFYTPWCKHSAKLSITWEEIARTQKSIFKTAKLDCSTHFSICQNNYSIRAYPTVKLFITGKPTETYRGERTVDGYLNHVNNYLNFNQQSTVQSSPQSSPAVDPPVVYSQKKNNLGEMGGSSLPEKSQREDLLDGGNEDMVIALNSNNYDEFISVGPILVKFFSPGCPKCIQLAPAWKTLARKNQDKFQVAELDCTLYPGICTHEDILEFPTIKLFFEGRSYLFAGVKDIKVFENFVARMLFEDYEKENEAKSKNEL